MQFDAIMRHKTQSKEAYHRVLDLSKLQEVLPELFVADLSLQFRPIPALSTAASEERMGSSRSKEQLPRTVPPTNIFRVRVGLLPEFLGTAAFASTFLPSITCSRCCGDTRRRQRPLSGFIKGAVWRTVGRAWRRCKIKPDLEKLLRVLGIPVGNEAEAAALHQHVVGDLTPAHVMVQL